MDLVSINDLSRNLIGKIFKATDEVKKKPYYPLLENKVLAMIFAKPSTRTRVSFEAGLHQMGGHAIYLGVHDIQLGRGETIADTAKVLSRYCDMIMARLFEHKDIVELAKHSTVPVINGLTDLLHPCQALSDMYTIDEKLERLKGVRLAYLGDGNNNVTHSLLHACSKLGMHITVACPKNFEPDKTIVANAKKNAKITGSEITITTDPKKAAKGAEVLYTDTWVSMGKESQQKARDRILKPYQVNEKMVGLAESYCIVMHCLPAHRGHEITDKVMDGPHSVVFDQAENRMHVEKAIMGMLLKKN